MKHTSVLLNSPIEFIESTKISPFVSKVQIKVCYVGDEPNRNGSIITKEVAKEMAPSLRACPIVGFFNEVDGDFEEHNRQINISNGEWRITDTTVPYGFVPTDAKLWFATYLDDEENQHEYLCTEGYIWDHAYPEAKRIIREGNNQSMELDEGTLDATWSKDKNGKPEFFIINEALISKLCILGENSEPCFEGAQITNFSLVIDETFQEKMFSMMNEIKELLTEGGAKVFNTYAVEIGDALWSALYSHIQDTYPAGENHWCSKYDIDGIFEEAGQKFAILCDHAQLKYYRLDFSITEAEGIKFADSLVEVTKTYTPAAEPQFAPAEVEAYAAEYAKKKEEEKENQGKNDEEDNNNSDDSSEEENSDEDETEEDNSDDEDEDEKKKKKYSFDSIEEIPEYMELLEKYSLLEGELTQLKESFEQLNEEIVPLREFKVNAVRAEKKEMISKFYMLSDEDKKDVIENIDNYSLDDIEAKLSVICVRNKVSFAKEDEDNEETKEPTTFSLEEHDNDSITPAWVKAALDVAKNMK